MKINYIIAKKLIKISPKKFSIAFFLFFICNLGTGADAQTWNTVGRAGFSAGMVNFTSMAIDGSGKPYVVFEDYANGSKATVMKYDGSSWVIVGSAGFSAGEAEFTSIAIDGGGTPYVSYEDGGNSYKATVMKYNGSSWVTVGSAGFSPGQAAGSIAIDGSGTPYVAYQDGFTGPATVMKYNGSGWVTVGSAGFSIGEVGVPSIAIDVSGTPYVAYEDFGNSQKATVMKYNGTGWVTVGSAGISAGEAQWVSMAINGSGTPYVAYMDYANSQKATLMQYTGSSWVNVGSAGFSAGQANYISMAINSCGMPYVAYEDGPYTSGAVTAMKYNGSSWVGAGSADFSAGRANFTSIAIDSNGTPYVVYEDYVNSEKATVMKLSVAPIMGVNALCVGDTATLSDSSGSGVWGSGSTSIAAVGTGTGIITGISGGTTVITYSASCQSAMVTVTVNPLPFAGAITGRDSVCAGDTINLTGITPGGAWSITNTAIGTVTGTGVTGILRGISAGRDTARYIVSNSCGADTATFSFTVRSLSSCTEDVNSMGNPVVGLSVYPNPNQGCFNIHLSSGVQIECRVIITSIIGEKVKEFTIAANKDNELQLNTPPGIYFISAVNDSGNLAKKMIVVK